MQPLATAPVRQIAIVCQDVGRATAFYRDTLGVPFLFAAGPQLAFFDAAGTRLLLGTAEGGTAGTSVLYFLVQHIEGVHQALADRGVQFIETPHMIARMPDHDLWLAAFHDSEGNALALMEEKRRA